jgi:hypothetical protein
MLTRMTDDLALFDLPTSPRPVGPSRVERGQPGGTYERTVVAEVTVTDGEALCAAAVHAFDSAPSITIPWNDQGDHIDEEDEAEPGEREMLASDPGAALSWLIEPVDSHLPLDEAGAARTYASKVEVEDSAEAGLRVRWAVMLKVQDVTAFRQLSLDAGPDADPAEIENSIAAAWNHAAEPYAPLRRIPGISWTPVDVRVEHIPAAERWRRRRDRTGSGSDTAGPSTV